MIFRLRLVEVRLGPRWVRTPGGKWRAVGSRKMKESVRRSRRNAIRAGAKVVEGPCR